MSSGAWNPDQYERFAAQRSQPFWDLVALIEPGPIRRAVDLGCGTGELSAALAERLDIAEIIGVDSSPAMLERAEAVAGDRLRIEHGDLATWSDPNGFDLVVANASLHWVGDHDVVLGRWLASLRHGGQLAVQVPANSDHPSHTVAVDVAHSEPFLTALGGAPPPDPVAAHVLTPERYAELLHDLGVARQHVRLQVYGHVLDRSADVVEWVKGTSLTRFFSKLPAELHQPFLDAYTERLLAVIGGGEPFFYPFKRILMWASTAQ